jgi:hypothetical protein
LGSYYEACDESTTPKYAKISPKDGQQAPDYIKVGGKSYKSAALTDAQKKQAQSVQDWVAATAEEAKCDYNYYKSCGQTGQSEVIKVSPKGQGVSPPMYIKVSGKCYAFTYPTAAEKASAKQAEGWQEGTNCEQQCCPKDFSCKITYHETLGSPPLAVDLPYYFKYSKGELRINFNTAELAASLGDTTGNFGEGFISAGVPACGGASVKAEALLCITMQGRKGCLIMDLASMAAYSQGTETLDAFSSRTNLNITESKTIAGLPVICFTKEYPYLYHACVSIDERCPLTMSYDIESSQGLASMVATDVQFGIPDSQFEPQNVVCSVKLAGTGETAIADAMKKLIECMFPDLASFSGG